MPGSPVKADYWLPAILLALTAPRLGELWHVCDGAVQDLPSATYRREAAST